MKLSMKNKFPNYILFPELPTFFGITASQTLCRSVSFELLFTVDAAHEYRIRNIFKLSWTRN